MRITQKELERKFQPWCKNNILHRRHNQELLFDELEKRSSWRMKVLYACDNFKETFNGIGIDLARIIFPSHRIVNKRIGTHGYLINPDRNQYHIIRHSKHKWRVVKYKPKKEKAADMPVDVSKLRCGDIIRHSIEGTLLQVHHIDEAGLVHFIAYADKYDKYYTAELGEMQREPYRCTFGYIQDYRQATIKEKTWLRKWIKQCKAGKIGHLI